MTIEHTIGTRAQVWHGTAKKTSGGLTKSALMMNKHGRIVSRKKHETAKREKRLVKAGYVTKKGHFGFIKKGTKGHKGHKGSRKMKGGMVHHTTANNHHATANNHHAMVGHKMKGGMNHANTNNHHAMVGHKMKGGMALGGPLAPLSYNGQGVGTSGVNLQFVAGNAA